MVSMTDDQMRRQIEGTFQLGPAKKRPELKQWNNLDKGFYAEAEADGQYAIQKLAELDPMPDEIVADAILRAYRKFGVTNPDSNTGKRVAEWARCMATLESYFAEGGVRTVGPGQSTVREFFGTDPNVQTLFPAYIESQIIAGQIAAGLVDRLVFATEQASASNVKALVHDEDNTDENFGKVAEGAELPVMKLTTSDSEIYLDKYGGQLQVTYEAMRDQALDELGFWIRRIGMQIALDETDELLEILIAGDGTTHGAAETNATDRDAATGGTPAYSDLVSWGYDFNDPYVMDIAIGNGSDLADLANLSEFKDAALAQAYTAMKLWTPLSVTYLRRDAATTASNYEAELMIGIDSRYAAKKYTYGGFISEADKIIERQINVRTFSYYAGFRKVDPDAVVCYDINAKL